MLGRCGNGVLGPIQVGTGDRNTLVVKLVKVVPVHMLWKAAPIACVNACKGGGGTPSAGPQVWHP